MGELYREPFDPVDPQSRVDCDLRALSRSLRAAYLSSTGGGGAVCWCWVQPFVPFVLVPFMPFWTPFRGAGVNKPVIKDKAVVT